LTFGGDICPENGEPLDTIEGQTDYVIRRLKETLEFADASLSDVIKTIVFLKYIEDFGKMRDVYKEFFKAPYPARSATTVDFVHSKVLIQMKAVAYRPKQ